MTIARRPRRSLIGAVLAFVAILGLVGLSGWHNAMVNDADPVHAMSIGQAEGSHKKADPDGPIHVVAHATASFLSIAAPPMALILMALVDRIWSPLVPFFRDGNDPSGLLRPPQG